MQAPQARSDKQWLNLRQFEVLRSIMRCRTTVGAAHELGMSQPAVSNAIKTIEAQLRFRLFDRVANRLVPTEEARLLAEEAEPLFAMHRALTNPAIKQVSFLRLRCVADIWGLEERADLRGATL